MERSLLSIVENQRIELNRLLKIEVLPRHPMTCIDVNSPLAQAVIGMRRSGKSVVCRQALLKSGVAFGYVDFDDESLAKTSAENLDEILSCVYSVYGPVTHFYFDEIQNVEGWHLFVNRLLRNGNHSVSWRRPSRSPLSAFCYPTDSRNAQTRSMASRSKARRRASVPLAR